MPVAGSSRRREVLAQGPADGDGPGEEGAAVADGDRHDVRREPEVRVEHGAHHLHRVAVAGEVVGDDQRREPGGRGDRGAEALPVNPLEHDPEHDRAPADEHRRGVEVRDRRAPLQDRARDEAERVDGRARDEEAEGGGPEDVAPAQPGREEDEQREDVDHHARVEGLGAVEDHLVLDLTDRLEPRRRRVRPGPEVGDGAVEAAGVLREPGEPDARPAGERRVALAQRRGAERLAGGAPRLGRGALARQDRPEVGEPRERRVPLLGAGRVRAGELDEEPGAPLDLDRVLQAEVEVDALREVHHRALEPGPLLRVHPLRRGRLLLDRLQVGLEHGEREAALRGLRQAEEPEDVGVVDLEDWLCVGELGTEHDVEEPLVRADRAPLVLERLRAADEQQRVPRDGVDGLHAAALEHREPPERVHVEPADGPRGHEREPRAEERERARDPGGEPLQRGDHAASCAGVWCAPAARRRPRRSAMAKWTRSPRVTSTVETYGMSQPGFSTTCRMESVSSFPKLAWKNAFPS